MPIAAGTSLGPYQVVARLGAGGMGEVYRARDVRLGRDVAIKALPAAFVRDAERLTRFRREAQTLASLNHPNIAAIYGLEEPEGAPHLVLELVEGETLSARLARGALPVEEALRVGVQVAAAMEAAHQQGVIHRDLKPGNIMITPAGVAKVLDFGLARQDVPPAGDLADSPTITAHVARTEAGMILGTAAYMSPEQARGLPVDRRSDVWAFGCVLFECLTGRATFSGETVSDLIAQILTREAEWSALPAETPPRVREALRRCLRRDAEARPRDIRDVRIELAEVLAGHDRGGGTSERSIAVLPFENLSGPDDEYFADGVTDEVLSALGGIEGLQVAARTSCFAFKGRREDLRTIGEKLHVATVLEGSVRRSGARLRITAQMVNAADGYQLWSERFDGEMTDVFEVQDRIAAAITARLQGTLAGGETRERLRKGTSNVEAYELFLRGRALMLRRGSSIRQAIPLFESAIELDPRYADALAHLADAHRLMGTYGMMPPADVMPRARSLAEQALVLAPDLAEAHATLANVAGQYDRDLARAVESWGRALATDPNHVRSICERAAWSHALGGMSIEDAVKECRRATGIEPLNAWVAGMCSLVLSHAGRHAEAIAEVERGMDIDRDSFLIHWMRITALGNAGEFDRALDAGRAWLASSGRHPWALHTQAWIEGRRGHPDVARAVYDELEARSRFEFVQDYSLACAAFAAGLRDVALEHARRAVDTRDPMVVVGDMLGSWVDLRSDARFAEIEKALRA